MNIAQTINLYGTGTSEGAKLAWESRDHGKGDSSDAGSTTIGSKVVGPVIDKAHEQLTSKGYTYSGDKKNSISRVTYRVYKSADDTREVHVDRKGKWSMWTGYAGKFKGTSNGSGQAYQIEKIK